MERGLTSYDQCRTPQLKAFCEQRRFDFLDDMRKRKEMTRKGFFMALVEAHDDDEITFGKFMLLPTELRLQIYKLHITWQRTNYSTRSGNRFQELLPLPPLASTSRRVRAEFIPLWYEDFRWHIFINGHNYRTHTDIAVPQELEWDPRTDKAFRCVPLQHITAIYLSARYVVGGGNRFDNWTIDFSKNERPAVVEHPGRAYSDSYPTKRSGAERYAHEYIKTEINQLLGRMAERPEGMRLRREDGATILDVYVKAQDRANVKLQER